MHLQALISKIREASENNKRGRFRDKGFLLHFKKVSVQRTSAFFRLEPVFPK